MGAAILVPLMPTSKIVTFSGFKFPLRLHGAALGLSVTFPGLNKLQTSPLLANNLPYYYYYKVKKDEMGRACSTNGGEEKCI
jgi:hypothetical protein